MAWPGKKTHTAAIRSTLCECRSEREKCLLLVYTTVCLSVSSWLHDLCQHIRRRVYNWDSIPQPKFPASWRAITPSISIHAHIYVCARSSVITKHCQSPLSSLSKPCLLPIHPLWLRGSPPTTTSTFSLIFSLSLFSLASTALITHTPQSGPSFGAFEVILAQILLSYTADKTWKGLCLRASGSVQVCVCVCVSFCRLNQQCLLFRVCLYLSECVYKRNLQGRVWVFAYAGEIKSIHTTFLRLYLYILCMYVWESMYATLRARHECRLSEWSNCLPQLGRIECRAIFFVTNKEHALY